MQEDRIERKMLRWTAMSVCVGIVGVLIAALALANDLGFIHDGRGSVAADPSTGSSGDLSPNDGQGDDSDGAASSPSTGEDGTSAASAAADSDGNADATGPNTDAEASPGIQGLITAFITERVWRADLQFWPALWHVTVVLMTVSAVFAVAVVAAVGSRRISDDEAAWTGWIGFAVIGVGAAAVALRAFIHEGIWMALALALVPLAEAAVAGFATVSGTVALANRCNPMRATFQRQRSIDRELTPAHHRGWLPVHLTFSERVQERVEVAKQLTPARRQQLLQDVARLRRNLDAIPKRLRQRRIYKYGWKWRSKEIDEFQQALDIAEGKAKRS